jgi:hypothetical protein
MEATEWVEQDEPGVCITIREFGDGTRELRRVRFRYVRACKLARFTTRSEQKPALRMQDFL